MSRSVPAGAVGANPGPDFPCLEVLDPGLLATIQDAGRPGLGRLGIAAGGAADPGSLAAANHLLGNAPGVAAVELTLAGAAFRALRSVTVALAGADLGAHVRATGEAIATWATVDLRAGETLAFGGGVAHAPGLRAGCRAYLAVPGGIDVPVVLGGRSTALGAGFGGLDGRPLRPGDELSAAGPALDRSPARWTGPTPSLDAGPLRIVPGPHAHLLGPDVIGALEAGAWTVGAASDRMGIRLAGDPLPGARAMELASLGVLPGAIQLPADGRPIVLLADCQPTGGYPVVAVVIRADRAALGQLVPGEGVAFRVVDLEAARHAAASQRSDLDHVAAHLREAAAWDALWRGAGG